MIKNNQAAVPTNSFFGNRMAKKKRFVKAPARLPTIVEIPATTLRNSIDEGLLDAFVWSDWVPVDDIEQITEEHLRQCVLSRARVNPEDYDLALIKKEIGEIRLANENKGVKLESRVMSLCVAYNTKLRECGYRNFVKQLPKLAVSHIMQRLSHPKLKERMSLTMDIKQRHLEENFWQVYERAD